MFDFDQRICRQGSHASKLVERQAVFGRGDVIPLWVADMDFASPPAVVEAIQRRAEHPLYGYTATPETLIEALLDWLRQRHHWQGERGQVALVRGMLPALQAAIRCLSRPGAGVVVMPPVYPPFFDLVSANQRSLRACPLRLEQNQYQIDFDRLEALAAQPDVELLLLCSPHNPLGRIWSQAELQRLLAICRQHKVAIFSDEIHADLTYPDRCRHRLLVSMAQPDDAVISAVAPGKTFNTQALGLAALISQRNDLLKHLLQDTDPLGEMHANPFSLAAFEAGYRHGGEWLDALMRYLQANRDRVMACLRRELAEISVIEPQAGYLLWLDCRALGLDDQALSRLFIDQAGVGLNPGWRFGTEGSGFMRMNIASPAATIDRALRQISAAVAQHRQPA